MKTRKMYVAMFVVLALVMGSAQAEVVLDEDFDLGEDSWLITEGPPHAINNADGNGWYHVHGGSIGSERDAQTKSKLDGKPGSGYEGVFDPTDQQVWFSTAVNPAIRPTKWFSRTAAANEDLIFSMRVMVEYGQGNTYYGVAAAQVVGQYPYHRGPWVITEARDWAFIVADNITLSGNASEQWNLFNSTQWEGQIVYIEIHMSADSNEAWAVLTCPTKGLSVTSAKVSLIEDAQTLMNRAWMQSTAAALGYVDDYKVELIPVPEPATLASLALGGVLLLLRCAGGGRRD